MKVEISFKHLDHTESLDQVIVEKTEKLKKYLGGKCLVNWTCSVNKGKHMADLKIVGPKYKFSSHAVEDTLYKSIDSAVAKLEKQLVKKKEKWKNHIHQKSVKGEQNFNDSHDMWLDYDEDLFDDVS